MRTTLVALGLASALWFTPALSAEAPGPAVAGTVSNDAIKLSGLVRFVVESCPGTKPDYARFKEVVERLGTDLAALSHGEALIRSATYTQAYQKDPSASCRLAQERFGPNGTIVPGLIGPG
ncbi:hypothetical protein [Methylobacterium indicum]|uniref:Uncharacterized protein n=1 Tax=Methylobacterium indicum TaxID=1775910 RepID=A0A8H8WQ15_9HYPH|nr:hypothetical protein [Methylobacterium indicum]BCM82230.1 hypothetical protein mvi_06910 [Methylobacterium indicum]